MNRTLVAALLVWSSSSLLAQKVTIKFDGPPMLTSVSKAPLKYNKDFAYSLTFDDATDDAITTVLPLFRGGKVAGDNTIYPPLTYTDGCGNALPFKSGLAWNTANQLDIDIHLGNVPGSLTWKQLDTLYDLGWDVFNHTYSHKAAATNPMTPKDYTDEIDKNNTAVRTRTKAKIEMPIFIPPSSDTLYHPKAFQAGHRLIFDQQGQFVGYKGLQVDDNISKNPFVVHRQGLEESVYEYHRLEATADKSSNKTHFWYNEFTHRIDDFQGGGYRFNLFKNYMKQVEQAYGKSGSDRMWMAPLQEVYEYLIMRQSVDYSFQPLSREIVLDFNLNAVPTWLRRKTLTLIVHSNVTFSQVDVPAGVLATFNGRGAVKLVNLDFTNWQKSTAVEAISTPLIAVKPNPVVDELTLDLENGVWNVSVFNEMGQMVLEKTHFQSKSALNVSFLNQGMYYLLMRQGDVVHRSKFIKIN
jgi:Secretion system C-terminal sorting domain/Polysaccharide deacetylase